MDEGWWNGMLWFSSEGCLTRGMELLQQMRLLPWRPLPMKSQEFVLSKVQKSPGIQLVVTDMSSIQWCRMDRQMIEKQVKVGQ